MTEETEGDFKKKTLLLSSKTFEVIVRPPTRQSRIVAGKAAIQKGAKGNDENDGVAKIQQRDRIM